jgi:hypothetical protein
LGQFQGDEPGEDPVDEHNHALDALRYLVAGLDAGKMARLRGARPAEPGEKRRDPWLRWDNEALWTRLW